MNILFSLGFIATLLLILFQSPEIALTSIITASEKSLQLSLKMCVTFVFWLGIIEIISKTKLAEKMQRFLRPVITFIMGDVDEKSMEHISLNVSANILGVGNASTPAGINAISSMNKNNLATKPMIIFFVMNATSLQMIPTSVISLRQIHGSVAPYDIIIPSIIASTVATVLGVVIARIFIKD